MTNKNSERLLGSCQGICSGWREMHRCYNEVKGKTCLKIKTLTNNKQLMR